MFGERTRRKLNRDRHTTVDDPRGSIRFVARPIPDQVVAEHRFGVSFKAELVAHFLFFCEQVCNGMRIGGGLAGNLLNNIDPCTL